MRCKKLYLISCFMHATSKAPYHSILDILSSSISENVTVGNPRTIRSAPRGGNGDCGAAVWVNREFDGSIAQVPVQ